MTKPPPIPGQAPLVDRVIVGSRCLTILDAGPSFIERAAPADIERPGEEHRG